MRNCGAGIGSESNRRRDIRDNTEEEYEHMRRKNGNTHFDNDRRGNGCHENIVGRGRNAHPADDARNHRQEQREEDILTRDRNDDIEQGGCQTSVADNADDNPSHTAGNGNADSVFRTGFHGFEELHGSEPGFLVEEADHDGNDDGDGCREGSSFPCRHQTYEGDDRKKQIAFAEDELEEIRNAFLRETLQTDSLCFKMNHKEDSGKVKRCGKDGRRGDRGVGIPGHFGHKECRCPHDGRHDLTAGRSSRFNRCRKFGTISGFFHDGNGYGTGTDRVGYGRTGVHPFQSTGNDSNLGRTAGREACDGVGQVNEEGTDPGLFQECAEQNEQDNETNADADGRTHDGNVGIEQLIYDRTNGFQEIKSAFKRTVIKDIGDETAGDDHDRNPGHTAAQFKQSNDTDESDHHVEVGDFSRLFDERIDVQGKI